MWPLRQQQRPLGSKTASIPWHVSSCFLLFPGDKLANCLVIEIFADQAVARYVRMKNPATQFRSAPRVINA